jgi:uncharacterized protein YndB with AHSA1/START domain
MPFPVVDGLRSIEFGTPGPSRTLLTDLVRQGAKRATAGLHADYEAEGEPVEHVGELLAMVDDDLCHLGTLRVTRVEIRRFADVPDEFAVAEGEGDLDAADFRASHLAYWGREGRSVDDDTMIVCIWFDRLDGPPFDVERDLLLARTVDLAPSEIWQAWTDPNEIVHWFTPAPWTTTAAEIDLRPGGIFRTVMCSPEGETNEGAGCVLEAVPDRRFVWTSALAPGHRPLAPTGGEDFAFTAIISMEPEPSAGGQRSRYTARVLHATPSACRAHADMGFVDGWGAALDQLVTHMSARRGHTRPTDGADR